MTTISMLASININREKVTQLKSQKRLSRLIDIYGLK